MEYPTNKKVTRTSSSSTMTATTTALLWPLLLLFCAGIAEQAVAFQPSTVSSIAASPLVSPRARTHVSVTTRLNVGGMGWDNENFLESLGRGPDAIEKANAEYERIKRNLVPPSAASAGGGLYDEELSALGAGKDPDALPDVESAARDAALSAEQIERIKQQNEQESGAGGEMFKKLLERAQQTGGQRPPPPQMQPQAPLASTATTPSGPGALPAGFENLSVEAQAALFRELMKSPGTTPLDEQQSAPEQWPPAPGPRPAALGQAGMAADGRRIGRNRDADSIVNSADVYFARLKRDSRVRNDARYQGDLERAEAVFADPSLQEIKLHINPYMEEQRKKELAMLETAADEVINFDYLAEMDEIDVTSTGISYKEKLKQMKLRKSKAGTGEGGGADTETPKMAVSSSVAPPSPKPLALAETAAPPKVEAAEPIPSAPTVPTVTQPVSTTASATPSTTSATKKSEEMHRDIRTLMGLLLKHRGGPGFGVGRIQGAEIEKFEKLADEIIATLRAEALSSSKSSNGINTGQQSQPPFAPVPPLQPTATAIASSPEPILDSGSSLSKAATVERISSMVACIEGAVLMYKNSPPELQSSVLITLRAALVSAVTTCHEVLGPSSETTILGGDGRTASGSVYGSANERIKSMIAVLEGAILMYKNSPPELQGSVLVTLRAALLSAIHTCNDIVGNGNGASGAAVLAGPPTQFTDVVPETAEPRATATKAGPVAGPLLPSTPATVYTGSDENTQWLEKVYEKLKNAAGDGKLGLREDLSAEEAEDLANDISQMRMMLVEELESGIPESEHGLTSTTLSVSTPSKYQQMLAKARAESEGRSFE